MQQTSAKTVSKTSLSNFLARFFYLRFTFPSGKPSRFEKPQHTATPFSKRISAGKDCCRTLQLTSALPRCLEIVVSNSNTDQLLEIQNLEDPVHFQNKLSTNAIWRESFEVFNLAEKFKIRTQTQSGRCLKENFHYRRIQRLQTKVGAQSSRLEEPGRLPQARPPEA